MLNPQQLEQTKQNQINTTESVWKWDQKETLKVIKNAAF